MHFYAHDGIYAYAYAYAYDSAGLHVLPYRGIEAPLSNRCELDENPDEYEEPQAVAAAVEHVRRNGIGPGYDPHLMPGR